MTRLPALPSLRPLLLIISALVIGALVPSCRPDRFGVTGSGAAVTEMRYPGSFEGLSLCVDADVVLHVDSVCRVEITAQPDILDVLSTSIRNNRLSIDFTDKVWKHSGITIHVYAPSYVHVSLSGSGSINNTGSFSATDFYTDVSGSGSITISGLQAVSVRAVISGSGDITLSGQAQSLTTATSGSGDMRTFGLPVSSGNVTISGAGFVEIHASQELEVGISGSGDVYYKGTPAIDASISGSGKLHHVN